MDNNPWNKEHPVSYGEMWLGANECIRNIQKKISGDENTGWFVYAMSKYMMPALRCTTSNALQESYRCLLLGSNEGHMERELCENGYRGEIIASDIADKALARARKKINALGYKNVTYIQADLNNDSFDGMFDFIIAEGVLHHISNLSCYFTEN